MFDRILNTPMFIMLMIQKDTQYVPHKVVKHTQTIRRQKPTNCLSVFDHFEGLALKG